MPYGRHVSRNIAADKERVTGPHDMKGKDGDFIWEASESFFNTSWIYGQVINQISTRTF